MRAKSMIFTHFSARYGRIPFFSDCDYVNNRICFAYDFMYWNERDSSIQRTTKFLDMLNVVFKMSNWTNEEDRSKKRMKLN